MDWVVFLGLPIGILALGAWMMRRQSAQYQTYLSKHVAETQSLVETQRRTHDLMERQTKALERIAELLEKRA